MTPAFRPDEAGLHGDDAAPGPLRAIVWAFFLGCSWTWVIGMCFPVLLVRDHGIAGWWVFAIPNVLGAAAMGWVLTRTGADTIRRNHPGALRWFSDVTLAFHVFVFFWLGHALFGPAAWAAVLLPLAFWPAPRRHLLGRWLPWAAIPVALLSWGAFQMLGPLANQAPGLDGTLARQPWHGIRGESIAGDWRRNDGAVLFFLAPSILGFLLCPYLDASFNRARAALGRGPGRAAFTLGFGFVFASMIVLSLVYAGMIEPLWRTDPPTADRLLSPAWRIILGVHMLVQGAFTVCVHLRERGELDPEQHQLSPLTVLIAAALLLAAAAANPLRLEVLGTLEQTLGQSLGEWGYRVFLLAYGAIFPGYVWLRVLPARPLLGHPAPAPVTAIAIGVALALAYAGFVHDLPWCLPASALALAPWRYLPLRPTSTA